MRLHPESKTPLWRSSRWGGRGCWVYASRVRFRGISSLHFGGKGALLTALANSAVRSHQAVRAAGLPLLKERAEGGTHRPCDKCIDRTGATQREGYALRCIGPTLAALGGAGFLRLSRRAAT